ncbi:MAG: hydrogen peroxide-inducible genes activator [Alloprevotella sp.]
MTLQQLEYVVALSRLRHFGRAAEACGVTQSTLSAMVQKLEKELGLALFTRSVHGVAPTTSGEKLIAQARHILDEARRMTAIATEERGGVGGVFRLGILPTIAPYLLPRFFPSLCLHNKTLDLRVVEMKTDEMKRALDAHHIDAGIMVAVDGLEDFDCHTLYYEQFMAYVAREDALFSHQSIKTADLADEALWLLDEGHCFRDQLVKFCSLKSATAPRRTYTLGSIETFMRMVENGMGVTFIPELALEQLSAEQRGLVRPFAIPIPTREIILTTTTDFVRHTLRQLLVDAIRRSVPPQMLKLNNTEQRV